LPPEEEDPKGAEESKPITTEEVNKESSYELPNKVMFDVFGSKDRFSMK
jgi:hypothetical protein